MGKWAVFYHKPSTGVHEDGTPITTVTHVDVDADDAEGALKAAEAFLKKAKITEKPFRADPCPEWSVDPSKASAKPDKIRTHSVKIPRDADYVPEHWEPGSVEERIHRLRRIVLVHSILYYRFDKNVVADAVFDAWAYELAGLKETEPEADERVRYMREEFRTFDGSGGSALPLDDPRATSNALKLLDMVG